jgi:hypothetical protein
MGMAEYDALWRKIARQSDFYKHFVCALLTFGNFGTGSNMMITP